jgi:hypothetical protein
MTEQRMQDLNVNAKGFLQPEEEKLFKHVMVLNEAAIAFEDAEHQEKPFLPKETL